MTRILARQSADGTTLEETDLQKDSPSVKAAFPRRWRWLSWSPVAAQYEGTDFVVIDVPDEPALDYGETATRTLAKNGDVWEASWNVTQILTLAQAKEAIANLAMQLARRKVFGWTPTVAQWAAAGDSWMAAYDARAAVIDTRLDALRTQVQAATTVAECYAIYQQLEALD